jgi:predicted Zn-dependent peptidase
MAGKPRRNRVAALTRDDLAAFHARYYTAANASITLVGDISRSEAEKIAEPIASGLPKGEACNPAEPPPQAPASTVKLAAPGQPGARLHRPAGHRARQPGFLPAVVGNYTLGGGGFVSRLMKEVRDKRGYAYSVYSYFAPMRQTGPFQIGLQTKRSQAKDAIKVSRDVLAGFLKDRPERGRTGRRQGQPDRQLSRCASTATRKSSTTSPMIGFYGCRSTTSTTTRPKYRRLRSTMSNRHLPDACARQT